MMVEEVLDMHGLERSQRDLSSCKPRTEMLDGVKIVANGVRRVSATTQVAGEGLKDYVKMVARHPSHVTFSFCLA